MLTALSYIAGLAFGWTSARTFAHSDAEMLPEEEEKRWEPSIEELYSDGGGDA